MPQRDTAPIKKFWCYGESRLGEEAMTLSEVNWSGLGHVIH